MILHPDAYWKIAQADRAAYLIDGAAYFRALREAMLQARHSILMLGWDFHSQVLLVRPDTPQPDGFPNRFLPFLNALVHARKDLHIHLLNWDFAALYVAEREPLPVLRFSWKTDRRLQYAFDSELPFGGSHHQKIVVIDDSLAFFGGLDITTHRWDTPDHAPSDPRRQAPDGALYGPFHDIQMAVTGGAARALGELCRARWVRATGKTIPPPPAVAPIWPAATPVHFENVPLALVRNFAAYKNWPAVHEVIRMHEQAIRAAKRFIYLENEYFTSFTIAELLAERLSEPEGPEVVLVLPKEQSGWLEQSTMGVVRSRVLRRLREKDKYGRLRAYAPVHGESAINLHSKAFVVDDVFLKIGSSNLSNRSMGLDSEIDGVIEAGGEARVAQAIAHFRATLLGEHLGVTPEDLQEAYRTHDGSLIGAIESLRGQRRTLIDLAPAVAPLLEDLVPHAVLIDPERPMEYASFVLSVASERQPSTKRVTFRRAMKLVVLVAVLAALALALGREDISLPAIRAWFARSVPAAPWTLLLFCLAGMLLFLPALPLLAAVAVLVDPLPALGIGLVTSLAGALSGYLTGRSVRRDRVRRLAGEWAERVFPWLEKNRLADFIGFRLFSGVPYGLANLLAGAARVPFLRYFAASAISLALTALTVVGLTQVIGLALSRPTIWRFAAVGLVVAVYAWASRVAQRAAQHV